MKQKLNKNYKTVVISGFPGIGKSYIFNNKEDINILKNTKILDSDSSKFDKSKFPENYIQHIKSNLNNVNIILVSSHKEVRDALKKANIKFIVVYPDINSKEEYIQRYKDRNSPDAFINLLNNNWDNWINEIEQDDELIKMPLYKGFYLKDILYYILISFNDLIK